MHSRSTERFALTVYQFAFSLFFPLAALVSLPILLLIRKRRKTFFKRFGWQKFPRMPNDEAAPVWIHALSVGEILSAMNLIRKTHARLTDRPLYLSVSTLSGFELARDKLGPHVDGVFYFPYDVIFSVWTCIRRVRPQLFVLTETDVWPGFLAELRRRRISSMLVNGRLSPESFRLYRRARPLFQPALGTFDWIYPQSEREADRFRSLGVEPGKIRGSGNLKFDTTESVPSAEELQALRDSLRLPAGSRVFLAGSTHPGEEAIVRNVFLKLKPSYPELVLIVAPRHPERSAELLCLLQQDSLGVSLFSQPGDSSPGVVLVDRMGCLARLYALADIAFVGASLVPKGGQNPIEPACHGKPILFGPDMRDFPDVSRWLVEAGGAIQVSDEDDLFNRCRELLSVPALARAMGEKARRVVEENRGSTERIVRDILEIVRGDGG